MTALADEKEKESRRPLANGARMLPGLLQHFPRYGLLILGIVLFIFFTLLRPATFATTTNVSAIIGNNSITALLALASMVPIATNNFDLSVGYGVGLLYVLPVAFQVKYGMAWPLVVIVVLAAGLMIGLINGILVEFGRIDSFIATLGTGTVLYAITLWYTGGQQITGTLQSGFNDINGLSILGIPGPGVYLLIVALIMWIVFEYLPIGRYLYAVGANRRAAELNGIRSGRYVIVSFLASGFLTAVAGIVLASRLQVGQSNIGLDYLLPALVGAFLGSTTIHPGRVNVWGTVIAMGVLAIGIAGLEQLGSSFYIEPLFDGLVLIAAVGVAGYAARRRGQARRNLGEAPPPEALPPEALLPAAGSVPQGDSPASPPGTERDQVNAAEDESY